MNLTANSTTTIKNMIYDQAISLLVASIPPPIYIATSKATTVKML